MNQPNKKVTKTGTDIDEVKRQNANSGLTYNQVKQMLGEQYTGKK
ncbi:hypothetical protein [Bacillus sp. es.034]|jgi:hypothetical protein|nr:hypothetical protein [Bacillus sp. es.034]PFG03698.1 hypothetical protein ATG71_0369 [Bacillus sp. es.034]